MIPQFEEDNGEGTLLCPSCGGNYLHQRRVEVFERGEDSNIGLHVTVANMKMEVDNELHDNPSARRHGLKIIFSCETCKAEPVMTVAQHKGQTFVDFFDANQ